MVNIWYTPEDIGEEPGDMDKKTFFVPYAQSYGGKLTDTWHRDGKYNFNEAVSAFISLVSKSGKDVTDCMLRQSVFDSYIRYVDGKVQIGHLRGEEDYSPEKSAKNPFYGGSWIYDEPGVWTKEPIPIKFGGAALEGIMQQLEVYVIGAESVKTYWGMAARADYSLPTAGVTALVGKKSWGPRDTPMPVPEYFSGAAAN